MLEETRARFRSTPEAEARLLLLIDGFSHKRGGVRRSLEGRVKLAKLDFLLRYPHHLARILKDHGVPIENVGSLTTDVAPLDSRMMRYRYGPWDPSYYAILGALIGRGLVEVSQLPGSRGLGYSTTVLGTELAVKLRQDESFETIDQRVRVLRKYLDKSGSTLKGYLYTLPEITNSTWYEEIS
ncbi:hypothetical protein ACFY2T_33765 [Streptomyces sp. NPDC001260]|uniref:hypothetical protein n=1 Tax=Streptomyces sp. NPDC001260 TaxID=3364551 RepID=UPI0036B025E4